MIRGISTTQHMTDQIESLKNHQIEFVFRYYSYTTRFPEKRITREEAQALSVAGIQIAMVYQDWGRGEDYFTADRGAADAQHALQYAAALGQPHGSAIYFAVDDDLPASVVKNQVFTYFDSLLAVFATAGDPFKVGVYGSGLTCRLLKSHNPKIAFGWLAESTGWEESRTYTGWDVQQHISTGSLGNLGRDDYERCDAKTNTFGGFVLGTPLPVALSSVDRVVAQAREDIGVVEVPLGSNRGPRVNAMLAYTNTAPGNFWCAAAVAAWGIEGLGGTWPLPKSASCDDLLNFARRRLVLRTTPQRGDVFLVMRTADDAIHTGIVTGVEPDGRVATIEGNTDPAGSSNGYIVAARKRSTHNLKFIRWGELLAGGDSTKDWTLQVGSNTKLITCTLRNGMAFVPLRAFLSRLFTSKEIDKFLKWTQDGVEWNSQALPSDLNPYTTDGVTWVGVRAAAQWMNLVLTVDSKQNKITLKRPQA